MPFDNAPTEIIVDTPASLILEAAIKLIERPERWCRNAITKHIPGVGEVHCAWGAVVQASGGACRTEEEFMGAYHALHTAAQVHDYVDIARLNDDPSVTHTTVLEVMREAVEIARGRR